MTSDCLFLASELKKLCSPPADLRGKTFPADRQESSVYSTVLYSCNHEQQFPQLKRIQKLKQEHDKLPRTPQLFKKWPWARPQGGEEFKVHCSAPGWDRKWSFHRRGTACYGAAALERSPDGSSSRLKNKKGIAWLTSHSFTYISQSWCSQKPVPATVSMYRFESERKIFWLTFLVDPTQAGSFFFFFQVKSSEAKLGAVVMGLPCNRV